MNRDKGKMRWVIPLSLAFYSAVALAGDITCDDTQQVAERVICDHAILNRQYEHIYDQQQKLLEAGKVTAGQIASWRQERDTCIDVSCVDVIFSKWKTIAAAAENTKISALPLLNEKRLVEPSREPVRQAQHEVGSVDAASKPKDVDESQGVRSALEIPPPETAEANNHSDSGGGLSNSQTILLLVALVLAIWGLSKIPPIRWIFKLLFVILGWAFSGDGSGKNTIKQGSVGRNKPERSKCVYCGSSSYGYCSNSPFKKHEHNGDEKNCIYCGSSSYGYCSNNPSKKHKHGSGGRKCRWCGSTGHGYCSNNPQHVHEQ